MAKKIDEADVKKECPSCGLGVTLDSATCEFCGWDFEEEDEWILQIEKLERDLMLEKQKFEPGSINEKIESTLRTPALERIEAIKTGHLKPVERTPAAQKPAYPEPRHPPAAPKQAPSALEARVASTPPEGKVRRVRGVKATPAEEPLSEPKVRKVKSLPDQEVPATRGTEPESATRNVRVVRKVKQ